MICRWYLCRPLWILSRPANDELPASETKNCLRVKCTNVTLDCVTRTKHPHERLILRSMAFSISRHGWMTSCDLSVRQIWTAMVLSEGVSRLQAAVIKVSSEVQYAVLLPRWGVPWMQCHWYFDAVLRVSLIVCGQELRQEFNTFFTTIPPRLWAIRSEDVLSLVLFLFRCRSWSEDLGENVQSWLLIQRMRYLNHIYSRIPLRLGSATAKCLWARSFHSHTSKSTQRTHETVNGNDARLYQATFVRGFCMERPESVLFFLDQKYSSIINLMREQNSWEKSTKSGAVEV